MTAIIDREMLWRQFDTAIDSLYTMRHVQEHSAQLLMFLGQQARKPAGGASQAQA